MSSVSGYFLCLKSNNAERHRTERLFHVAPNTLYVVQRLAAAVVAVRTPLVLKHTKHRYSEPAP
jgi:hypothetical protein